MAIFHLQPGGDYQSDDGRTMKFDENGMKFTDSHARNTTGTRPMPVPKPAPETPLARGLRYLKLGLPLQPEQQQAIDAEIDRKICAGIMLSSVEENRLVERMTAMEPEEQGVSFSDQTLINSMVNMDQEGVE